MLFGRQRHPEDTVELMHSGFSALDDGDLKAALSIAKELVARRHSSGHEVWARVLLEQGKEKQALTKLREGLQLAPQAYGLWSALGIMLSNLGMLDEALEVFENGSRAAPADEPSYQYNVALVLSRLGRNEDALMKLRFSFPEHTPPWNFRFATTIAYNLNQLGRHEKALEESEEWLKSAADPDDRAPLETESAHAIWAITGDRDAALERVRRAISLDPGYHYARTVLREINGVHATDAKQYRVLIQGPGDEQTAGFFRSFIVVADSPEEAFGFTRFFETDDANIVLSEFKVLHKGIDALKGVYDATARFTYEEE